MQNRKALNSKQFKAFFSERTWEVQFGGAKLHPNPGAFSPAPVPNTKRGAQRPFCIRSGWDSNPRALARKLISSQPRYDLFDTAPYSIARILSHIRQQKSRGFFRVRQNFVPKTYQTDRAGKLPRRERLSRKGVPAGASLYNLMTALSGIAGYRAAVGKTVSSPTAEILFCVPLALYGRI